MNSSEEYKMSLFILPITAISIVSSVEEHHTDVSTELTPVDIDISFNTEEGKFTFLDI